MSRFVSISEQELERIKQMKIYMVVKHELRNQNFNLKGNVFETETIDDGLGMWWLDIIALLLSENCGIIPLRSQNDLHKKLDEKEILQWFQTLRSSAFLLNSMLLYSQKVSDVSAKGLEQQTRIEQLQTLNSKLMKQESEAREHVMDLHNWAGIDEVKFASNFKI